MFSRKFGRIQWEISRIVFLGSLLVLIFSRLCLATEKDLPHFPPEEIVVTATRTERLLSDIPANASIVKNEKMERQKVFRLDDALRYQVGLSSLMVQDETGTSGHIGLRGFRGQGRTQLLLNGHPVNGGYNGQVDWVGLPIENVDRIEIVRGPYSALYGGTAMGGTIQIITQDIDKTMLSLKGLYGEDNTRGFRLFFGSRPWDRFSFSIGYEERQTDGFIDQYVVRTQGPSGGPGPAKNVTGWTTTSTPTGQSAYLIGDKGEDWWESHGFTIQMSFDMTPSTTMKGLFMNQDSKNGYRTPRSYLTDPNTGQIVWNGSLRLDPNKPVISVPQSAFLASDKKTAKNIYQLSLEHNPGSNMHYGLKVGFTDEYRNRSILPDNTAMLSGGIGTLTETPSRALHMEGEAGFSIRERHHVSTGLGVLKNKVEDEEWTLSDWRLFNSKVAMTRKTVGEDDTIYALIQDEYFINDQVSLIAGVRYDQWECQGKEIDANQITVQLGERRRDNYSPRMGVIYHPFPNTGIRAMLGKAFRTPPLHALYRTNISTKRITLMNPGLTPERTTSWELGFDQDLPKGIRLRATYFENAITNMIYPRLIDPNTSPETYRKENAEKGRTNGVELEMDYKPLPWLTLWGNWTYQEAKITENPANPDSEGKRVPLVPWCMGNIGMDGEMGRFYASLAGHYAGKVYKQDDNSDFMTGVQGTYDPYFILNAKVGCTIIKGLTLSVAIDNILDREYYEFNKAPGRRIFGELSYIF